MTSRTIARPFPYVGLRRAVALGSTAAIAAIIGVLTLTPINVPMAPPGSDKLHHLLAFAALTFPTALLYRRAIWWVVPVACLYGFLIELIQPHVGRHYELADFFADVFGAMIGGALGLTANSFLLRPLAKRYLNRRA